MRSHGVHFASYYFYKRNSLHTLNTFDSTSTTIMRRMWVIVGVVWCLFFDSNDRSFKCKLASKRRCKRNCDVFPFKVLCKWMRGFEWSTSLMINIVHIGLFSLCFWVLMWYNPWKLNCKCFKPILEVCQCDPRPNTDTKFANLSIQDNAWFSQLLACNSILRFGKDSFVFFFGFWFCVSSNVSSRYNFIFEIVVLFFIFYPWAITITIQQITW